MSGFHVVLGVSGSVAAYRAADLARDLMRVGCEVRVCLTDAAQHFVTANLFEALTGNPVLSGVFEEPERGRMAHIDWARWADVVVVAPASANTIAKLAHGIGEDMLTTLALATTAPLVIAPAMNPQMYASEPAQEALRTLASRAASIVEPSEGDVACGEHGQGKLASNAQIAETVLQILQTGRLLAGKKVLITSGPTQEPIDSVRFLSNRSSGKMGAALARAALLMGGEVMVISGPTSVAYPLQAKVVRVRTAQEMLDAGLKEVDDAHMIFGPAAVADFRPADPSTTKVRRSEQPMEIKLVENPDVIATLAARNPSAITIGFAAEPSAGLNDVYAKLERKGLYGIAANDVSDANIGFESDVNELTLIVKGREPASSGRHSKLGCALWLIKSIACSQP
ncbi:MAG TPA: bifunctional phosphopantothenoylcysteine decarboxylase/phosphopantothenate--cysteine ligase CoaBC [Fimbriimonas sp.]|nr:bifunctional phosphopantothenoylcysteine decarboxylase/phosphopantothenate--cysteine ligase CoaBC [Fimbriimonas sp.]